MRQLTTLDALFLAAEHPRQPAHVSALVTLDPSETPNRTVTLEGVKQLVEERIHLVPPFRWRLATVPFALDFGYWFKDPDFDLEYHIRELALPPPGDVEQLKTQITRIHERLLDRARPLWEMYLIHGLEGGRMALFTKVHHAAVDGASGAEILGTLFDLDPAGREIPPPEREWRPERVPDDREMMLRGLVGMPRRQLRAWRSLPRVAATLPALPIFGDLPGAGTVSRIARTLGAKPAIEGEVEVLESPASPSVPRVPFTEPLSAHRRVGISSLSLAEVKEVKNAHGTTVNDVIVSICAGALRRWLVEHLALPPEPLVTMVPVSVRGEAGRGTYGNQVSAMIVPIPTDEPDPVRRLERARAELRAAKERHDAVPAGVLQDAQEFLPPTLASQAARLAGALGTRGRAPFNVTISNVPGPQIPLYCAGAKVEAMYPVSAVGEGNGLNITVLSYMGRVDVAVVADREQVPDVQRIADWLGEELEALRGAAPEPQRSANPGPG